MAFSKTKKITIKQLQYLNISDENGVIDYQKFRDFKKQQLEKGYKIYLDKKDFKGNKDADIIDNEDIVYNGKAYKSKNGKID